MLLAGSMATWAMTQAPKWALQQQRRGLLPRLLQLLQVGLVQRLLLVVGRSR